MARTFVRRHPVACAAVAYAVLTCAFTYPQALHLRDGLPAQADGRPFEDGFLNAWILAWGAHAAVSCPTRLFDTNAFWPRANTLAYSDHMLGWLPVSWPVFAASRNALLTHNVVLLITFWGSGLAMFWLAWSLTRAFAPALAAGALYGFGPFRFEEYAHVQALSSQWAPLAMWCLHRCRARFDVSRRFPLRAYTGLIACGAMQSLCSTYYALMFPVFVWCYAAAGALWEAGPGRMRKLVWTCLAPAIWTAVVLPAFLPYLRLRREMGVTRGLKEVEEYSATLDGLLAAPECNALYGRFAARPAHEPAVFPGGAAILLAAFAAWTLARGPRRRRGARGVGRAYLACAVAMLWLAMGPYVQAAGSRLAPGPYLLLYRFVPGFDGLRAPGRFLMFAALAGSVLAGLGLHWLCAARRGRRSVQFAGAAAVVFMLLELAPAGLPIARVRAGEDAPPVYRWLARAAEAKRIVELPMDFGLEDKRRMFYSTYHWRRIVNGKSGFLTPEAPAMFLAYLRPGPALVRLLADLDIDFVIVHERLMPGLSREYERLPAFRLERVLGDARVLAFDRRLAPAPRPVSTNLAPAPASWRAEAAPHAELAAAARDGDLETAWESGRAQAAGMRFHIALSRPRPIRRVEIHLGARADEFPRFLKVRVSADGRRWVNACGPEQWPDLYARLYRSALEHPRNPIEAIDLPEGEWRDIELVLERGYPAQWAMPEVRLLEPRGE